MARPLRFIYPGAVYHLMARGDGGKRIFLDAEDHEDFLRRLGEVCVSHGWRVHAWVLMGNHFHLLVETPEPNLISGMKLLLGGFAQAWNRRYRRRGHVFQGRYKSVPVAGERASDAAQFRVVADYIHLNPRRAGLVGGEKGDLAAYPWSSVAAYKAGRGPNWLVFKRVLRGFELAENSRGRRAYVSYLEKRADEQKGNLSEEAMRALRQGWYLGDESFRDQLLDLVDEVTLPKPGSLAGEGIRAHGEGQAAELIQRGLKAFGLDDSREELAKLAKGDPRKVALAICIREQTSVTNGWIAENLQMGKSGSVSRLIKDGGDRREVKKLKRQLKM